MVGILPLAVLAASILFLAVWGGGAFPSSLCIVASAFCATAALVMLRRGRGNDREREVAVPSSGRVWVVVVGLLALSAIPLPDRLDRLTGYRRAEQNDVVRSAVSEAVELGVARPVSLNFSVTRNRAGTLRILLLSIAMLAAAVLGASLSRRQQNLYCGFLIALMTVVAVAGFLHQWVWPKPKTLWWLWRVPHGQPIGCFIDRTHHAGFVSLAGPLALAWLGFSVRDRRPVRAIVAGAAYVAMSFGILVSLSRGAVVAHLAASLVVLLLLAARRPTRSGALACLAVILVMACSIWIVVKLPQPEIRKAVAERLDTLRKPTETDSAKWRFSVWEDSLRIWRDYPAIGVGANGFRMVFPQYRTSDERQFFSHTENEVVSVLVEGGLLGVFFLLAVILGTTRRCYANVRAGIVSSDLAVGVAGTAVAVAAHNMVDFPLHAPAYAVVFSSMIGMVFSGRDIKPDGPGRCGRSVGARHISTGLIVTALLILLGCVLWGTEPYSLDGFTVIPEADVNTLARILVRSPTWGEAWLCFAKGVRQPGRPETSRLSSFCATQATRYDPNNYRLWESVGHIRLGMGDKEGAEKAFARMTELRPWMKPPKIELEGY